MKQIMQILIILAIILAVIMFIKRQPFGFQDVRRESTTKTKYIVEEPEEDRHHTATETYTKTVKPGRDGKVTVKEETKYKQR